MMVPATRAPQRLVDVLRDAGPHAYYQRCRDLAFRPADPAADALGDRLAGAFHRRIEPRGQWRRPRRSCEFRPAQEKPAGANAVEIAFEGKVVAVRPDGA
jgi:hypothetical protein